MAWFTYTPSTRPFEEVGLCGSVEECKTFRRSYPSHPIVKLLIQKLAHVLCVLSARLSLELRVSARCADLVR
jgi:hypothetical protein